MEEFLVILQELIYYEMVLFMVCGVFSVNKNGWEDLIQTYKKQLLNCVSIVDIVFVLDVEASQEMVYNFHVFFLSMYQFLLVQALSFVFWVVKEL